MRKTTRTVLAVTTMCMALAGCGSASKTSTPAPAIAATGTTCSADSNGIKECIVTLSETRRVDCIVTVGSHGTSDISCDWDHVSGADKEPER